MKCDECMVVDDSNDIQCDHRCYSEYPFRYPLSSIFYPQFSVLPKIHSSASRYPRHPNPAICPVAIGATTEVWRNGSRR
jgi:hypothetical protein